MNASTIKLTKCLFIIVVYCIWEDILLSLAMRMSFWHSGGGGSDGKAGGRQDLVVQMSWNKEHFWIETSLTKLSYKVITEKWLPQDVASSADWLIHNYDKFFAE